jgi:hypothetical protein
MKSIVPARSQFEEAIVIGAVFSPVLLTAFPFATSTSLQIAIAVFLAALLALTLLGYVAYRKLVHTSSSFRLWRASLLLLLASAMLAVALALVFGLGGPLASAGVLSFFLLLAALAWKKLPRGRNHGKGNPGVAGIGGALAAASCGALTAAFGSSFIQALVTGLHFSLALIATALLIRAVHEARATGHNVA